MKIVTFDDVKSLGISPTDCYEWVNDMITHKQEAFLPAKNAYEYARKYLLQCRAILDSGIS